FQPQNYSNDQRVTQKLTSNGNVANPQTQYTRPPVPATRRWLGWMRNDTPPPQPPATPAGQKPMPVPAKGSSGVIGAAYHASTPYPPSVVTTREPVPAPAPAPAKESSSMIEAVYHPDPMFRLIGCLHDDLLPSMREVAAMSLTRDFAGRPEAVEAILDAAQS